MSMKLEAYGSHIEVLNAGYGHGANTRFIVGEEREIGGFGLSVSAMPYPTFVVEWEYRPETAWGHHKWRDVLTLPEERTESWLHDLVVANEARNIYIVGIMPLGDITLPAYVVPGSVQAESSPEA
jgi:hypothetical protein